MNTQEKLEILASDSQYDLACSCGTSKDNHRRRTAEGRWLYPVPLAAGGYGIMFKTLLSNAKSELFSAIETLTSSIDTAISDNKATSAERTVVNLWFTIYNTKLEAFTEAVEAANDALRTVLKDFAF